jgi:hypothetical protein
MPFAHRLTISLLALLAVALPLAAPADVTVEEQATLSLRDGGLHGTETMQIAGEKQRTDSQLGCQGLATSACEQPRHIDIVRLDRGLTWSLEWKKQDFTETRLVSIDPRRAGAQRSDDAGKHLKSCPFSPAAAVDISQCELSAPKTSMEITDEVAAFAGHAAKRANLKLVQTCKSAAPSSACEVVYAFEVWLASEEIAGLDEQQAFQHRYLAMLGAGGDWTTSLPALRAYTAPYQAAIKQLAETAEQLKGTPLKRIFRVTYSGRSCGTAQTTTAGSGRSAALVGAGEAAGQATSSSAQHAASWGTADALERSTGSGVAGYVAGSAAGAFTGSLVSGLFAKKQKVQPAAASNSSTSTSMPSTTLLELTVETTALSVNPIPAIQFEPPPRFSKVAAAAVTSQNCPATAQAH